MTLIGFTGTRLGMTDPQMNAVATLLTTLHMTEPLSCAHHGDCIGADEQFDRLCKGIGIYRTAHPPTDASLRAHCTSEVVLEPRPYLTRNREIVLTSDLLIAAPESHSQKRRSGTWSTVRYAVSRGVEHMIVYPCGATGQLLEGHE